jgi:hypothetical protein
MQLLPSLLLQTVAGDDTPCRQNSCMHMHAADNDSNKYAAYAEQQLWLFASEPRLPLTEHSHALLLTLHQLHFLFA